MADYDPDSTASNYSIQPGKSVDYPSQGKPMDPADHPATSMPTATEHHDGTVASLSFMMGYDKNAGGGYMKSQMSSAQKISDSVPR